MSDKLQAAAMIAEQSKGFFSFLVCDRLSQLYENDISYLDTSQDSHIKKSAKEQKQPAPRFRPE